MIADEVRNLIADLYVQVPGALEPGSMRIRVRDPHDIDVLDLMQEFQESCPALPGADDGHFGR